MLQYKMCACLNEKIELSSVCFDPIAPLLQFRNRILFHWVIDTLNTHKGALGRYIYASLFQEDLELLFFKIILISFPALCLLLSSS